MERIIPITELQAHIKRFVEQVKKTRVPIVITQRGRAAAILADYETYEGHLDTLDEMSYPDWEKRLARAKEEHAKGKGIGLQEYLKKSPKRKKGA